eukprot:gene29938-39111_t
MLQVLENALEVCEYTDVVDVTFSHTRKSKQSRIIESLVDVLSISCGLIIGRRYKIMNPAKMRNTYGKLMYILMDTESYQINNSLGQKSKRELQQEAALKQQAIEELIRKYTCAELSELDVKRIIDSIADNEAFLDFNMKPVERILSILVDEFDPKNPVEQFSLHLKTKPKTKIGGACLTHDHATQFKFVLQTFTLWREVMNNMTKLWLLADEDITSESYRLVDTGQGYQRLQSSPRIRSEMSRILSLVQKKAGQWVGLSVVHLGDRDVPNALIFIDKYTQVARILAPIVQCMDQLPHLVEDNAFHRYVSQEWGSISGLRLQILSDFFKHGFDGS